MHRMFKLLLIGFISIGLMYIGAMIFIYLLQRKLQYAPTHRDAKGVGHAEFKPLLSDSGQFMGYWRPIGETGGEKAKAKRTIIFFHGNGGEALDREWVSEIVPEEDFLVILAEYPGYGPRGGAITEGSIFQSSEYLIDQVQKRWPAPITLLGESLGSGVACYIAAKKRIDRLAMISPFSSASDVAKMIYPYFPIKLLMRDKFDSVRYGHDIKVPVHIIHGTLDDVVPIQLGRDLFVAITSSEKTITEIPGYGHSNIVSAVTDSPFAETFRSFIRGE